MTRLWSLLLLALVVGWASPLAWAQTGPVADTLTFVNPETNEPIPLDPVPSFVRGEDQIKIQFSFLNVQNEAIPVTLELRVQEPGATQQTTLSDVACSKVDPTTLIEQPQPCEAIEVAGNSAETTIGALFPTTNLPNATTFELIVLVAFLGRSFEPVGAQFPRFDLLPPPPSVSIEGPVSLEPALPRQGDLITLTFTLANNKAAQIPVRVTFELGRFNPSNGKTQFIPMDFLQVGVSPCGLSKRCDPTVPFNLAGNERVRATFQFLSASLPPTLGLDGTQRLIQPYLLRLTAVPRTAIAEQTNSTNQLVVSFDLKQPLRRLSLTAPSELGPVVRSPDTPVRFLFTVENDTPLLLQDNALTVSLARRLADPTGERTEPVALAGCTLERIENGLVIETFNACDQVAFDAAPAERVSFRLTLDTAPLAEGDYQLQLRTGPVDSEADALLIARNRAQVNFTVLAPPVIPPDGTRAQKGPELRPIELKFVPSATVKQGAKVLLSTTVKNTGNRDAQAVLVSFSLKREGQDEPFTLLGSVQLFPRLGVGLELVARQVLDTAALAPGHYRVRVEVRLKDPTAPELDPQNNTLEGLFNVVSPEDATN